MKLLNLSEVDSNTIFTGILAMIAVVFSILSFIINSKRNMRDNFENRLFQMFSTLYEIIGFMIFKETNKEGKEIEYIGRDYLSHIFRTKFKEERFLNHIEDAILQRKLLYKKEKYI